MTGAAPRPPLDDPELERRLAPIVETLVNQIAHDVRNYAFTVGLQAELGERRSAASAEVQGQFSAVLRQVEALKGYLERLLLFGRPVVLRPKSLDASAVVRHHVQAQQFAWRPDAPPLAISIDVDPEVGTVRWDDGAIGHALRAVLDNAVRSADPAPPVSVHVGKVGERVVIEVRDRGAGIPADVQGLLWMPMRVRRHGGAGLGLAIARKMIAAHGGVIGLVSGPGGTVARIELPAEVPPA